MRIELKQHQRQYLKGCAHKLKPVVMVGQQGLTEAVLREIARNLDAHELIKIRVLESDRDNRELILDRICDQLDAASVQHIGKLLVVWRPTEQAKVALPK
jgi:RNA-binding protein